MAKLDLTIPRLKLNDGYEIPMLGFGTGTAMSKRSDATSMDRELVEQIKTAMRVGYRHLDGAEMYNNEGELGTALKEGLKENSLSRSDVFVTTKVNSPNIGDIPGALAESLRKLQTPYVDLYLIHQPYFAEEQGQGGGGGAAAEAAAALQRAWAGMEKVKADGLARSIGVSNFRRRDLEAVLATATVVPAVNQVEFHLYLQRAELKAYCEERNVTVSSYGPLTPILPASRPGPVDGLVAQLAKKYAVEEGEIALRWAIQRNVVAVTTSSKEQRLSDMLRVATFQFTPRELDELSEVGMEKHVRRFWGAKFVADDRS